MDTASQHWPILRKLDADLSNKVRSFMVMGDNGDGVIVATEDGLGYWLGKLRFESSETKTSTKPIPLDVPELVQMARGHFHILMLNKLGSIYSMGQNDQGQLGLGTGIDKTYFSPQLISSPHRFISVRCGGWYSLALTDDGKVWEWGSGDYDLDPENFSSTYFPSPQQILDLDNHRIVSIECSVRQSLALTDRGEVFGWGTNDWGQLGGEHIWSYLDSPILIATPSPVKSIAPGPVHTLMLTQTGEVYACGKNDSGQLGLPTTTKFSDILVKVEGLPPRISQIASHFDTNLSIAMSFDKRCFVWGELCDRTSISTPRELPPFCSTVESSLSFFCSQRNTSYSVSIQETLPNRMVARMSRMFDNPETNSDVQFVVEQRTIHSHRCILSSSSEYFAGLFSERWLAPVDPEDPIVRVTITDYSYEAFHAFLRFLYTDCFEVPFELLPELFELASQYLESDLQKLCLSRMRTTFTSATCCLYYPLTHRHSLLPELEDFQQELVQFASTRMSEIAATAAYQSMEPDLCDKLIIAAQNFHANF